SSVPASSTVPWIPWCIFGIVGSESFVMRSAEDRNSIAAKEGVMLFEMEGAGVWDNLPCVIVKAACDYVDSHKTKLWQPYAAATAAACMNAFLSQWVPSAQAVMTSNKVAICWYDQGNWKRADMLYEQTLETHKQVNGEKPTDTLGVMHNLALCWMNKGRIVGALALTEECTRKRSEVLGSDHPGTLSSMSSAGRWKNCLLPADPVADPVADS
ncbi:hypothetical protein PspLS_01592, partial [Pyricularia sp. CBS 133598]